MHYWVWAADGAWELAQKWQCPALPGAPALWHALRRQTATLRKAGWHRLGLEAAGLYVTIGLGPLEPLLAQARLQAQAVVLPFPASARFAAHAPLLARVCAVGAVVEGLSAADAMLAPWKSLGFVAAHDAAFPVCWAPAWVQRHSRSPWRQWIGAPQDCVVVGAGMAGAAVAHALALRGWKVTVLDAEHAPAQGATGLPVGLAAPAHTADDNALSQLTRAGVRLLHSQARALLQAGRDWAPSGAWNVGPPLRWEPQACWVRPSALVQAWLRTPGVQWRGGVRVAGLEKEASQWLLRDTHDQVVARGTRVVLANAHGALLLAQSSGALRGCPAMHAVRGMVSHALHAHKPEAPYPRVPLHGQGSLICHVPSEQGPRWYAGASYQPVHAGAPEWPDDKNHGANALRMQALAPQLLDALAPWLEQHSPQAWHGVRCVSADRLPVVGCVLPDDPGLWVCAGFGSRGLSLVVLCAELLAAQWSGEPWPVDARLAAALSPQRRLRRETED